MVDGPLGAAQPLCSHYIRYLLCHSNRRLRSSADHRAHFFKIFLLAVYALHQHAQSVEIEPASGDAFERFDQPRELSHHEVEAMRFKKLVPAVTAEFPPARRKFGGAWSVERNERAVEGLRPRFENPLNAVAGEARGEQRGPRQAAPRSPV